MRFEATQSVLGTILQEFASVMQAELDAMEVLHECGSKFTVKFLDRDGEVLRRDVMRDSWEATLTAFCPSCRSGTTAYNYCRFSINGHAMMSLRSDNSAGALVQMIRYEAEHAWEQLKRHMLTTHGVGDGIWSTEIAAAFAEWFTNSLRGGKRMNSMTLKHSLEAKARVLGPHYKPWSLKKAIMLAHKLDFVMGRDPSYRIPVLDRPNWITSGAETVTVNMPTFHTEIVEVLLFGLPPEHPMAMAA